MNILKNNDIRKHLILLRKQLKENANPERAVQEKRYLKSPYKFIGTSLPFTDKVAEEFRKVNKDAGRDYIIEVITVRLK